MRCNAMRHARFILWSGMLFGLAAMSGCKAPASSSPPGMPGMPSSPSSLPLPGLPSTGSPSTPGLPSLRVSRQLRASRLHRFHRYPRVLHRHRRAFRRHRRVLRRYRRILRRHLPPLACRRYLCLRAAHPRRACPGIPEHPRDRPRTVKGDRATMAGSRATRTRNRPQPAQAMNRSATADPTPETRAAIANSTRRWRYSTTRF